MNKLKSITKGLVSCSLVLFVILSFLFSPTQAKDTINVIISPEYSFQTLKGWGTSLSWWGNAIGSWKNEAKKNEILDLIFDESNGLGFNVARYNSGGGAIDRGVNIVEGFSKTPTYWMSYSGCSAGNTDGNNIVQYDYYGYENQQWKFELVK